MQYSTPTGKSIGKTRALRHLGPVVATIIFGTHPAIAQEPGRCVPKHWANLEFDQDDIFDHMQANFSLERHELEIGSPCAQNGAVTVDIRGRGDTAPRHQVWLVTIRGGKIDIPLPSNRRLFAMSNNCA